MAFIYLDNAATSHPRPRPVVEAVSRYLNELGASPGRSGHRPSLESGRLVLETRELAADFFCASSVDNVIFTANVTGALNIALKGYLRPGDHVLTTPFEHNAVLRPLHRLQEERNIEIDYLPVDSFGSIEREDFEHLLRENTSLVVINHASNVTGAVLDILPLSEWCGEYNLPLMVDAAQSAGSFDFPWEKLDAQFLCFTGHKGLMGPPGTGGMIIDPEMVERTKSFIEGGTGSKSDQLTQPQVLPDKYEAGTMNTAGIAGLNAAFKYLADKGLERIIEKKKRLTESLCRGLEDIPGIELLGPGPGERRTSTVSITWSEGDTAELSVKLDREYDIMTRSGLHCAPLAHKELGTYPRGALRFSTGHFNTEDEIDRTLAAIKEILG